MNKKLLEKLLKIIAKTQEVGSEPGDEFWQGGPMPDRYHLLTAAPPDEPLGSCCYLVSNPVIRLGDSRRGEEPSILHYEYYCKMRGLSRAQCYILKGVFYSQTARLVTNPQQSVNSCCLTPPISDTSGGQFVPVEA